MRIKFWGTRGSIAAPGPQTVRYGGNTSCVEMVTNSGQHFMFDCGTGARPLGLELVAKAPRPIRTTILLTHTHWDHIQGFPFFAPLFTPNSEITVHAPHGVGRSLAEVLAGQMEFTYFPVELGQLPAKMSYRDLSEDVYDFNGVRVTARYLNHPTMTLGYRVETDGVSVAYLCDHEPFSTTVWRAESEPGTLESILHINDREHAEFMKGCDFVIHDAQYTPAEYPEKKNWGHSTFEYVVELASAAGVRRVALTHHDPLHDDAMLDDIERRARALAERRGRGLDVRCAYEGWATEIVPQSGATAKPPEIHSTADATGALRVLIVDDDPNLRLLARAALQREGHTVEEAGDGEQGLRAIEQGAPDIVVLDFNMPALDGVGVLRRLRGRAETAALPVLMLTAQGDEASTRAAFDAGATDYLTKPFTPPQLATRLRACMARARGAGISRDYRDPSSGPHPPRDDSSVTR